MKFTRPVEVKVYW